MGLYHEVVLVVEFLLLVLVVAAAAAAAAASPPSPSPPPQTKPGCTNSCGNITIPYPFGLNQGCYLDETFHVNCTNSNKPIFSNNNNTTNILSLSIENSQLQVLSSITYQCFNKSDPNDVLIQAQLFDFSPFAISQFRNKFTVVGCDAFAALISQSDYHNAACYSLCDKLVNVTNGSCSGTGCCESSIPNGVKSFQIGTSIANLTNASDFNPCSYAFVVEEGTYNFSSLDLWDLRGVKEFPVVLDWAIGNITCKEAQKNEESYACKENSECFDSPNGFGYVCNCSLGFYGNPYLQNGCQDINECEDPNLNQCIERNLCENTIGNYTCACPQDRHGDGRKDGQGCALDNQLPVNIILGVSIAFLIMLLVVSWLYFGLRKRRLIKLREKCFKENGGYLLQEKLSEHEEGNSMKTTKIFTEKELKRATNNYHESRILGIGGQGIVYKGILPNNQIVAVKKSKIGDETQVEGFINEVIILSQINHRNVVKLLGCCLETRVPLLVYEFVTNGSLFDYIHNNDTNTINWEVRLKIATEVAETLSYMHSAASTPIIHRDIKTANILLDDNYMVKVSDFGASKLIPFDKTELTTLVQGTLGYLDPEYLHTSQLTEKSDVYSFGVVLIELLTRKKALSYVRGEQVRNLAKYFAISIQEHRLLEVLDQELLVSEKNIKQIKAVAMLARSCVSVKGEERPTMKEIAIELQSLCSNEKHPWEKNDFRKEEEEQSLLLVGQKLDNSVDDSTGGTTQNDSIVKSFAFEIGNGR